MTDLIDQVAGILRKADSPESPIPPTDLYNEGWMLCLLLDWLEGSGSESHPFAFTPGARWYSEALLASQFLSRFRGDPLAEGWTHADGCVGHFQITEGHGELILDDEADQFVVIEAKMGSSLSSGTTRAPGYDQAARNVACVTEVLMRANRHPSQMSQLAFTVVAPRIQIESGVFGDLVTGGHIRLTVQDRVNSYDGAKDRWFDESFLPTLDKIVLSIVSWEDVLQGAPDGYGEFYRRCLRYNAVDDGSLVTRRKQSPESVK